MEGFEKEEGKFKIVECFDWLDYTRYSPALQPSGTYLTHITQAIYIYFDQLRS